MEKALMIISLNDKQSNYSYWISKIFIERLYAIELLRNQYIKFNKDVQLGLQRVCRIVNQE